ncbi:MAG: hypothetical protein AB9842_04960 [Bacteroidales bacterium]
MKKLVFFLTASALSLLIAFPSGLLAQNITYTPLYYISVKIDKIPMMQSQGTGKYPGHVIDPSINYNERKEKPFPGGEMWNGHLKNWPQKKNNKKEM